MDEFYEKRSARQVAEKERLRRKILDIREEVWTLELKLISPIDRVDLILKKFDYYTECPQTQGYLKTQLENIQTELDQIKQLKINTEYLDLL